MCTVNETEKQEVQQLKKENNQQSEKQASGNQSTYCCSQAEQSVAAAREALPLVLQTMVPSTPSSPFSVAHLLLFCHHFDLDYYH